MEIHLMGQLTLPHPRTYFSDQLGWCQHVLDILPHLQALDSRNLQGKLGIDQP
jgi:hypothetical protein